MEPSNLLLPLKFYGQSTRAVARGLLGCRLVHIVRGKRISGIITETEAYLGVRDPACHTYQGRKTARVLSMYKSGGHAYVYFIYGMHFCFNVVTKSEREPEAVLIRALIPDEGIEKMRRRRKIKSDRNLCSGPGKLCQALGIDARQDGILLTGNSLFIERKSRPDFQKIEVGPRIGISNAGKTAQAAQWPLRYRLIT